MKNIILILSLFISSFAFSQDITVVHFNYEWNSRNGFKKLDNFDPDNEDIFQWASRNNVQPTNKVGPKNALEYMNATEITQRLTDEAELINK